MERISSLDGFALTGQLRDCAPRLAVG